jgi:Flp pilus assembly protein TadD
MAESFRTHGVDAQSWNLLLGRANELMQEAKAAMEVGNVDSAVRYWTAVPEGVPSTAFAKLQLGMVLLQRKDVAGARTAYDIAARADPRSYGAALGQAWAAVIEERVEDSVAAWRRASTLKPGEIAPWLGQARSLVKLKRNDEAKEALQKALAINPQEPEALALKKELGVP